MSNYNITVGPAEYFICKHPEPHKGPCQPSAFVHPESDFFKSRCTAKSASHPDGECGGVNGFHADDCEAI